MATVAMRRVDPSAKGSVLDTLKDRGLFVLPNTAGCFTARDAVAPPGSPARRSAPSG